MHRKIKYLHWAGFLFVAAAGSLLHFLYEYSGQNPLAAFISPVNESTWEHLKLLFFPYLVFLFVERLLLRNTYPRFFTAHLLSLLAGLCAIPILFYTYTGILGKNYLAADIAVFLISAGLSCCLSLRLLTNSPFQRKGTERGEWISCALLAALFLFFVYASFFPPDLALFQPPA